MKRYLLAILLPSLIIFSGCAVPNLKEAASSSSDDNPTISRGDKDSLFGTEITGNVDPTLEPPKNIKILPDVSSIGFEWDKSDDKRVAGYIIYRNDPKGQTPDIKRVARINNRYATHFVDISLDNNLQYFYQMATYNKKGDVSPKSEVIKAKTSEIKKLSYVKAIDNYPKKVKIIWRPHNDPRIKGYVIERLDVKDNKFKEIGVVQGRLLVEYIDTNLANGTKYTYRVLGLTYGDTVTPPSKDASATTKFAPKGVTNLMATRELKGSIDLKWNKSETKDVVSYEVMRNESATGSFSKIADTKETEYSDKIKEFNQKYYYKIVSVDSDGLKSEDDKSVFGSTLGLPPTPIILSAAMQNGIVSLSWTDSSKSHRAVSYNIYRTGGGSDDRKIAGLTDTKFVDSDVKAGEKVRYQITSVDSSGLESEKTPTIDINIPVQKEAAGLVPTSKKLDLSSTKIPAPVSPEVGDKVIETSKVPTPVK